MEKPKIKIPLDGVDIAIELAAVLAVIALITLPIGFYAQLPDTIPIHFNASGQADGYGPKSSILVIPAIGIAIYLGLTVLNRFPHLFNYPKTITEHNYERQYRIATKMMRSLNLIVTAGFAYIAFSIVTNGLSGSDNMHPLFLPIFLTLIFGTTVVYFFASLRGK